jgi:hypothetical protein
VTFLLVAAAERKHARERIGAEIEEATRVFIQFVTQTVKQLGLAVRLLSSDYAFASTFAQLRNSSDAVARATLESALQNYRGRIGLCSDATRSALRGADTLRDLGETQIRGKKGSLRIWAIDPPTA